MKSCEGICRCVLACGVPCELECHHLVELNASKSHIIVLLLVCEEGDSVVLFLFHGEVDAWMLTVQVMEELLGCCLAVGPNHKVSSM